MKLVITIEDQPNDRVKVTCDPTYETLAFSIRSGHTPTAAMSYAMGMLRYALEHNHDRKKAQESGIWIPRLRV